MFEKYFDAPKAIARHEAGRLASERVQFLRHLEAGGASRNRLRTAECYVLRAVEILDLRRLRDVTVREVEQAAQRWHELRNHDEATGRKGVACFRRFTRAFLSFHRCLKLPRVRQPFSKYHDDFVRAMSSELGFSKATIYARRYQAASFLKWYAARHRSIQNLRVSDIDAYTTRKPLEGWNPVTRHSEGKTLRTFLFHAEKRGWCRPGIASALQLPPLRRDLFQPRGPEWKEVQRLLVATRGSQPRNLRAKALLLLFARYGLRSSEASNLLLADIDWAAGRFTVRRAKRGGFQQFPLSEELGTALRRYIEEARPRRSIPQVFLSLNPPFRPLEPHAISNHVGHRMRTLGIASNHCGPHALRHACATRLLHEGLSFFDIADFLGHRDVQNVNVYARLSPTMFARSQPPT